MRFDELVGMKTAVDAHNLLRPEAMEACFYLWRVTGKQMYREWAWSMFRAFQQNCKARPVAVLQSCWAASAEPAPAAAAYGVAQATARLPDVQRF